ncbi:hypothetical protein Y1Q_0022571 [Alligator mississippiensis]|uniref:Uncharacterized protein n=1 Tax=Alligator mississippiensis TaxID=8496 RepID=A0A151NQ57_ALLMI|nr:hypothetical protein Y1Q_0022571 [Alligator mississippiensis]
MSSGQRSAAVARTETQLSGPAAAPLAPPTQGPCSECHPCDGGGLRDSNRAGLLILTTDTRLRTAGSLTSEAAKWWLSASPISRWAVPFEQCCLFQCQTICRIQARVCSSSVLEDLFLDPRNLLQDPRNLLQRLCSSSRGFWKMSFSDAGRDGGSGKGIFEDQTGTRSWVRGLPTALTSSSAASATSRITSSLIL